MRTDANPAVSSIACAAPPGPGPTAAILYSLYDVFSGYESAWAELTGSRRADASFEPRVI